MEINHTPDPQSDGCSVNGRKRMRSPSISPDQSTARRRLDDPRGPSLEAVNDENVSSLPVKKECVSEMDVLDFLNAIPLQRQTTNVPTSIILAQESRKIHFRSEPFVIAAQRGSPSNARMIIEFSIDDNQMSLISLWRSRHKTQR